MNVIAPIAFNERNSCSDSQRIHDD